MKELTCIVCPAGCSLAVEQGGVSEDSMSALSITGNRCPRGELYAKEEICDPRRVVTATCEINRNNDNERSLFVLRRVPVKTAVPCPKDKIPALLADIYKVRIDLPVKAGDIIIANWQNYGINIIATRTII